MSEWKPITETPDSPVQVYFFSEKLTLWNSDPTNRISPVIETYRDERYGLGFWDGESWAWLGTGHDVFEFDYDEDQLPTHWKPVDPPPSTTR